jgi:alkanesulfonate monooxygenase SsuD/methylene tetrahydromethanopterin reductase-like flavin-dependent oxidoreductase (luciferase family)
MITRPEIGMWAGVADLRNLADDGRFLDSLGIPSIWSGEQQESMVAAGVLAAVVKNAEIGTGITQITRPPALMALGAAAMQVLTDNRFRLGLGLGGRNVERWMGISWKRRSQRFIEYVRAFRACMAADRDHPVTIRGEFYQIENYGTFTEFSAPAPPVWVAASGPMMLAAAGEVGDGVLLINMFPPRYFHEVGRDLLEAGARRAGRDPGDIKIGFTRYTAVDSDRAVARERMRATLARSAMADYHQSVLKSSGFEKEATQIKDANQRGDVAAARAAVSDDLLDAVGIAGTPDDVRRKIVEYAGYGDFVLLHPAGAGLSIKEQDEHNRRIAETVAG